MEGTAHKRLKTSVAEDNNGSAPPTAGHGISLPPSEVAFENDPIRSRDAIRKRSRKNDADMFREEYTYGSVMDGCISKERKSCIWHGDTFSWEDESSGTMWAGVHGADLICVVSESRDLDVKRLRGSLVRLPTDMVFFDFMKSLISEIEDFAGQPGKLCQRFYERSKTPFGVVSVIPESRHAAPCVEDGERKAIEFLQEKMNSDTIFTVSETIQTTISAFQHLLQRKFRMDEIKVFVMDPYFRVCGGNPMYKDPSVEELDMDQIKEHLDVINKRGPPCHKEKIGPCLEDHCPESRRLREWKLKLCSCSGGPGARGSTKNSDATD